jgi:hypothetical protein
VGVELPNTSAMLGVPPSTKQLFTLADRTEAGYASSVEGPPSRDRARQRPAYLANAVDGACQRDTPAVNLEGHAFSPRPDTAT